MAIPLRAFQLFNTKDLDCAREQVAEKFCAHKLEAIGNAHAFHARHHFAPGDLMAINFLHYGATVLIEPGEMERFYLIQLPVKGGAQIRNGRVEFASDRRTGAVLNPDRCTTMVWGAGCEQLLIYIDTNALNAFAEQLVGRRLPAPVVFDPQLDLTRPEMERWRRHTLALFSAADAGRLFGSRPALDQRLLEEQHLANLLIHQPSNIQHFLCGDGNRPAAIHVRKALRYIIDHADRPVALADIAHAADVPVRTLQHAFRQTSIRSPMRALRHERLMRVRHELGSGHCQASVTDMAAKWGFYHFGRFSQYYRSEFGELPSKTRADANSVRQ